MSFTDLPLELLSVIIRYVLRPFHLVQLCLVNKDFYVSTVPQLYEQPAIYAWHTEAKKRATQLFWTLANCPKLARYVRRLELRDFPKAISRDSVHELMQLCVSGLANCINLTSCTWTRDGSLKDDILEALSRCPSLRALEINGRHVRNYDPDLLHKFKSLQRISVIMPTAEVVHALPGCFQSNFETLQELTIICKFTSVVADSWLQSMAPSLAHLRKLHLAGCPKVTHEGMIDLLRSNIAGLTDLALEGLSPAFDMKELARTCSHSLSQLSSVTLTFPATGVSTSWLLDVENLLFDAAVLKQFHLYTSGSPLARPPPLDTAFITRFIGRHRRTLTRFAVLRLPVDIQALECVIRDAERLEQLFICVWRKDLNKLGPIIGQASTLRTLHITYAYSADRVRIITSGYSGGIRTFDPHRLPFAYNDDNVDGSDDIGENTVDIENDDGGDGRSSPIPPQTDMRLVPNTNAAAVSTAAAVYMSPLPTTAELEDLASQFGSKLTQFGVQTRVWQVERIYPSEQANTDSSQRKVRLAAYESPDVPDVFLVART